MPSLQNFDRYVGEKVEDYLSQPWHIKLLVAAETAAAGAAALAAVEYLGPKVDDFAHSVKEKFHGARINLMSRFILTHEVGADVG